MIKLTTQLRMFRPLRYQSILNFNNGVYAFWPERLPELQADLETAVPVLQ